MTQRAPAPATALGPDQAPELLDYNRNLVRGEACSSLRDRLSLHS